MNRFFDRLQPAVRKETKRITAVTFSGVILMWVVFAVLHFATPESVPFDYTVILGGIGGGIIAVLNFFLMALTVQSVAAQTDEDTAKNQMKVSYRQRLLLQLVWMIAAMAAPCFQVVAGIAPLLFPSLGIKAMAAMKK